MVIKVFALCEDDNAYECAWSLYRAHLASNDFVPSLLVENVSACFLLCFFCFWWLLVVL